MINFPLFVVGKLPNHDDVVKKLGDVIKDPSSSSPSTAPSLGRPVALGSRGESELSVLATGGQGGFDRYG